MTEKTNYELTQGRLGKRGMVDPAADMAVATSASAYATLAVADELRQLRELLDGVTVVNSDGSPHFIRVRE